jgi:hypothetical protein
MRATVVGFSGLFAAAVLAVPGSEAIAEPTLQPVTQPGQAGSPPPAVWIAGLALLGLGLESAVALTVARQQASARHSRGDDRVDPWVGAAPIVGPFISASSNEIETPVRVAYAILGSLQHFGLGLVLAGNDGSSSTQIPAAGLALGGTF